MNIGGSIAANGVKQLATGKRPSVSDLFMTPANALKLTAQLATMRGAAMKIGQMISMDSGDFLPKEFADILARLRADAQHMPRHQLIKVLKSEWGEDWRAQFSSFEYRPIAAASIGQVHRGAHHDGETLAMKIQYPGVKESIDSDVKNVSSLLRLTGLIPAQLDVKPLIEEGRKQLHQEADYEREAEYLCKFATLLSGDDDFIVPDYYPELSTDKILTMSYIESDPIEDMVNAPQDTRDRIATLLIELALRELFEFQCMQTDPNFANYRYETESERIVLLDFGASRDIGDEMTEAYRNMISVVLSNDANVVLERAIEIGFAPAEIPARYKTTLLEMIDMAIEPLRHDEPFDFGNNQIAADMRDKGMELAANRNLWHLPPTETVFIQRKLGGVYMLATRLKAKVNIRALVKQYARGQSAAPF